MKDNELIAEFMGLGRSSNPAFFQINGEAVALDYHTSWDCLMPVVEKIHKLGKMVTINFYDEGHKPIVTKIYSWGLGDDAHEREQESNSAIESVYNGVVEFIKWYNDNKM